MRINTPQICHETIDGEVVVINLENGCYYSLRDLSAAIWHHIHAGSSRDAIVEAVTRAYADRPDAGALAAGFIDQLVVDQLVAESGPDEQAAPTAVDLPVSFTPPALEKFTDMQDLLLLDPIHEVDNMGWPHKPTGS